MGVFRSDEALGERELKFPRSIIVSMSPPGYPSAWLHPCRARFRFAWQNHCSSLRYLPINSTDEAEIQEVLRALDPAQMQAHDSTSDPLVHHIAKTSLLHLAR